MGVACMKYDNIATTKHSEKVSSVECVVLFVHLVLNLFIYIAHTYPVPWWSYRRVQVVTP